MIIGFEGGLGSGKTIGAVRYLLKDFANGRKVFSNIRLRGIDYEHLNVLDIMGNENLTNVSILIDEITVFMDCRSSISKMNKILSYFILQTRKRNCTLYFTTQDFSMVDKRLMKYCEIQVLCSKVYNSDGSDREGVHHYSIVDVRDIHDVKISRFYLDVRPYFDYYDTDEIIMPPVD